MSKNNRFQYLCCINSRARGSLTEGPATKRILVVAGASLSLVGALDKDASDALTRVLHGNPHSPNPQPDS